MKNYYFNKLPIRVLLFVQLIIGTLILSYLIEIIQSEIELDTWAISGPLFGLVLIVNAFFGSKIKSIRYNTKNQRIEIQKDYLFKSKLIEIDIVNFRVKLKTADNKKKGLIKKYRLVFYDLEKEIEELKTNVLNTNNGIIKKVYYELKELRNQ